MKYSFLIYLFCILNFLTFSQEVDSTLVRLQYQIQKSSNKHDKIKSLIDLGEFQLDREFNKSEQYFLQAKKLIETCDDDHLSQLALIYNKLGVINRREGNYGDAFTLYYESKNLYENLKDTSGFAGVIHNLALLYRFQGEDKKAITNYKKSLEFSIHKRDSFNMAATYNMMGVSYRRLGLIDSALINYKLALNIFTGLKLEEDIRGVSNNLATLYSVQKKYNKSLPIKLNNLEYYKKVGNRISMSVGYYNVSRDYSKLKKHTEALNYADSSLIIAKEEGLKDRISKAYLRKSAIYRDVKDFRNAYSSYRNFKKYSDSILEINSVRKIKEFELKRDLELKNKEMEIKSEVQKSRNRLYILLFLNLLVLGILGVYLMRKNYKNKIKYVATKLDREKLKKELLDEKVKVSEAELKWLVADNKMRLTYLKEFYDTLLLDAKSESVQNTKSYIKGLLLKIQMQINTEEKLNNVQEKVESVNRYFETKLMEKYPSLTKSEREICGLLRINLSIKEMASIRNSTVDSIKSIRYRLRKKLNLDKNIELEKFIQNL